MPHRLVDGLRRFRSEVFPTHQEEYRRLVVDGQHPHTLFITCSDSRVVPVLLTDAGPGELFVVRNAGGFVPPFEPGKGFPGTAAAVEYAVLRLGVRDAVVCGHSHCGAIRALYAPPDPKAPNVERWLALAREARVDPRDGSGAGAPEAGGGPEREASDRERVTEALLRRTEERSVALQVRRLLAYPAVRERVEAGELAVHGWHYVIEDGEVRALDRERGEFLPLDVE